MTSVLVSYTLGREKKFSSAKKKIRCYNNVTEVGGNTSTHFFCYAKMTKKNPGRSWIFTLNNYQPADIDSIKEWEVNKLTVGKEVGESGTPHLQGAVSFKKTKRFTALKKLLPTAHWEKLRGGEKAYEYCRKEGDVAIDIKGKQGRRSDLQHVMKRIKTGDTWGAIYEDHPGDMLRYERGFRKYKFHCDADKAKSFRKLEVLVYWGDTGTGKTRKAYEENPDAYMISGDQLKKGWWDGYESHKTLIIDEYDSQVNCTWMLRLLDGYKLRLATKGGHTWALWDKVIITSNIAPDQWHGQAKDQHKKALARRITKRIHFGVIESEDKIKWDSAEIKDYIPI